MIYCERGIKYLENPKNSQLYKMLPSDKKSMYFTLYNIKDGRLKKTIKVDNYLWDAVYKAKIERGFKDITESLEMEKKQNVVY